MTVRCYKSTDTSAPVLTGQVGSLIALLDACLVSGYGSQAAAGWTKPYTGTNKAVFRNSASVGTGFYLNVQDHGAVSATDARVWGYETCTAQDTGSGQFPTTAQFATGLFIRKSATANSTARPWVVLADETVFYLFVETGDQTSPVAPYVFMFGDVFSYKPNDAYRCLIIGRTTENTSSIAVESFSRMIAMNSSGPSCVVAFGPALSGHYMARASNGVGGSYNVAKHTDSSKIGSSSIGNTYGYAPGALPYPSAVDGGLVLAPVYVHAAEGVRGYLKGIWAPCHDRPLNHLDTFTGNAGGLSGKSFLMLAASDFGNSTYTCRVALETSNTWS